MSVLNLYPDDDREHHMIEPWSELRINLRSYARVGMAWEVARCDTTVLASLDTAPEADLASGIVTFPFRAKDCGSTVVYFMLKDDEGAVYEQFEVAITILRFGEQP